tara:strand:- start:24007 stop:24765 length:759 start_codon:yes stop_codon:yes gene_type:complete
MKSKFILITGSNGDLGKSISLKFLENGYKVIGIDISSENELKDKNFNYIRGDLHQLVNSDVYRHELISKIKNEIPETISKFTIINNAATQITKKIIDFESDLIAETFNINTIAPFILVKKMFQELLSCKGNIINISSIHSIQTKKGFSAYAASKSALDSLTRSMAIELSPHGIQVNGISPAALDTNMLRNGFINNKEGLLELSTYHPSRTIGSTAEVSNLIYYLCSSRNLFLTGSTINIDGGIRGLLNDPDA